MYLNVYLLSRLNNENTRNLISQEVFNDKNRNKAKVPIKLK